MTIIDNKRFKPQDNIPEDSPVVFISYAHDETGHIKEWVKQFADDLTTKGAIYVLCDCYLKLGAPLTHFMESGIRCADRVLVIGTPEYKERRERSSTGGVPFESTIISNELLRSQDTTKFIPILRQGSFEASFPTILTDRMGLDFKNDDCYEDELERLIMELRGLSPCRPELSLSPEFSGPRVVDPSLFEKNVLEHIRSNPKASTSEMAEAIGISPTSYKKVLSELVSKGFIRPI